MTEVALIACCKSKLETAVYVSADELYTGQLFQAQLAYARQVLALPDNRIFVLSAKYQLLGIKWLAMPYEKTLAQMNKSARREWAIDARMKLYSFTDSEVTQAHLLAGSLYRDAIQPLLEERGVVCVTPHPASHGYGKQVAWYKKQVMNVIAIKKREILAMRILWIVLIAVLMLQMLLVDVPLWLEILLPLLFMVPGAWLLVEAQEMASELQS